MLHVLNLIIVVVLLPVLTSSYPQKAGNRWREMYDRLQAGYPSKQNPVGEDRGIPLRRVLDELNHLEHEQQQREMAALQGLLPPPQGDSPWTLLPPGAGSQREGRKAEDLLARLLGGARMPAPLPSAKRGSGFVGAPGSAGGPNIFGRR